MPDRRKGAPGSFGAPLDELLPKLVGNGTRDGLKVDVHRRSEVGEAGQPTDRCHIFLLNQRLYERAKK